MAQTSLFYAKLLNHGERRPTCWCPSSSTRFSISLPAPQLRLPTRPRSQALCAASTQGPVAGEDGWVLQVRQVENDDEVEQVAMLRAETYYEDQMYNRFVASFKNQFAEQELRSIKTRILEHPEQRFACLAAVDTASQKVIGTADVRIPEPREKLPGTYISNVCVNPSHRRLGVASALLAKCCATANDWSMQDVYAHVKANNESAELMYIKFGFHEITREHKTEFPDAYTTPSSKMHSLGSTKLLRRSLLN
mmetsp:Transcript_34071/g.47223  ORF Transcript_34071/g.47223 Transcript_34071/m.47223 type:complete len:251 (+) Transcript_34071:43-795(+)